MNENSRAVLDYIAFIVRQKLDSIPTPALIDADQLDVGSHESHSVFVSPTDQPIEVFQNEVLFDVSSVSDTVAQTPDASTKIPNGFLTEVVESSDESSAGDTLSVSSVIPDDREPVLTGSCSNILFVVDSPQELEEVENDIDQIKSGARNKYGPQHHQGIANRFIFKAIAISALLHVGVFLGMSDTEADQKTSPTAVVRNQNICSESSSNAIQTHISRIGINVDQMSPCDIKTELNSIKLLAKKMAVKRVSVSKPCLSIWMEAQKKSKQCMNRAEII